MTDVTEHHAEEERKGDNREEGWVDFSISWNAIRVDDLLERQRELVVLKLGWWVQRIIVDLVELRCLHGVGAFYSDIVEFVHDFFLVFFWDP